MTFDKSRAKTKPKMRRARAGGKKDGWQIYRTNKRDTRERGDEEGSGIAHRHQMVRFVADDKQRPIIALN
jgi:hypothetical protein